MSGTEKRIVVFERALVDFCNHACEFLFCFPPPPRSLSPSSAVTSPSSVPNPRTKDSPKSERSGVEDTKTGDGRSSSRRVDFPIKFGWLIMAIATERVDGSSENAGSR